MSVWAKTKQGRDTFNHPSQTSPLHLEERRVQKMTTWAAGWVRIDKTSALPVSYFYTRSAQLCISVSVDCRWAARCQRTNPLMTYAGILTKPNQFVCMQNKCCFLFVFCFFLATGWSFASPYETSYECDETKSQNAATQRQPHTKDDTKVEMCATRNLAGPAHYLFTLTTLPGGQHWRICFTSECFGVLLAYCGGQRKGPLCSVKPEEGGQRQSVCLCHMLSGCDGSQRCSCVNFFCLPSTLSCAVSDILQL